MHAVNDYQTVSRCSVTLEVQVRLRNRPSEVSCLGIGTGTVFYTHVSALKYHSPLRHNHLRLNATPTVRTHRQSMGTLQHLTFFRNMGALDVTVKGFKLLLAVWSTLNYLFLVWVGPS